MHKLFRRENFFKILIPVLTVVFMLFLMEFSAWTYTEIFSIITNDIDFKNSRPAPYMNAQYFSKDFVAEAFYQPGGWKKQEKIGLIPKDFNGRFFRTSGGLRSTSFQPEMFENTIHIFGGSTLYSSEVPDDHTIASHLQRLLNKEHPGKYVVKNYGLPTISIVEQVERLKTVEVKKSDIVIFYDGINEINENIFYANPDYSLLKIIQRNMDAMSWIQAYLFQLASNSYFVRLFLSPINYSLPEHLNDDQFIETMLKKTTVRFRDKIKEAYIYSTERHAAFFHFLQPHLFADNKLTKYEEELSKNKYLIPIGFDKSFKVGYPELQRSCDELPEKYNCHDISDVLNERLENEEFFFDHMHVNHKANRRIAQKMFEIVKKPKKLSHRTQQLPEEQ